MNIGVIGLGSIAQKAYLPVYTSQFPEHDWYFSTRSKDKLKEMGSKYGVPEERLFTQWQDLIGVVDAVFIHTPTETHEEISRTFLDVHIPVFIDKPLTENFEATRGLLKHAQNQKTMLMTGFNRRFAPMIQEMKEVPGKNHIISQKNQVDRSDFDVRYRIYDMMIHPLDTALYLLDEPAQVVQSKVIGENGHFSRAWVMLETSDTTAYVSINNESGTKLEKYEVQSKSGTTVLENLTDKVVYTDTGATHSKAGDWVATLEKRGFVPMIEAFLKAVDSKGENPVSISSALQSHDLCETIISKYEKEAEKGH